MNENIQPQDSAKMIATTGCVIIFTDDGNMVALTPGLARKIGPSLEDFANLADEPQWAPSLLVPSRPENPNLN